ncbi:wax ester/triacylglycerol synthase domain-containing protein [Kitasatospora camelliae]|uniref:Wax ester/triacylglycerol synthase domain-containing protein n=1 Tax=Kitasatospora camelliae TaxID=3156397 RepID=A0AAU8JQS0_9ACTN
MDEKLYLSPVDEAHASDPAAPMFSVVAYFSGEPPAVDVLRERVAARWGAAARLRRVLPEIRRGPGRLRWGVVDRFDPRRQVVACDDGGPAAADLHRALLGRRLPDGFPPWRLELVPHAGEGMFALVMVVHHALMDAASTQTLFGRLLDGAAAPSAAPSVDPRPAPSASRAFPRSPVRGLGGAARVAGVLLGPSRRLPVDPADLRPETAWRPLDAGTLEAARSALPGRAATRTEVVLAAAAGALRAVHGRGEQGPGRGAPLFAGVPVDLRSRPEELGNVLTVLRAPLPVDLGRPEDRLAACRGLIGSLRADHLDDVGWYLLNAAARVGPGALRTLTSLMPRVAPVGCTSIRWRRGPWCLDGRPLTRVVLVGPPSAPGTVYLSLVGYADALSLCVVSHTLPGDSGRLAARFEQELAALGSA